MSDETLLAKVSALLERAGHETTPEEEARTSALVAARLIVKYKLALSLPPPHQLDEEAEEATAPTTAKRRHRWAPWWAAPSAEDHPAPPPNVSHPASPPPTPPPRERESSTRARRPSVDGRQTSRGVAVPSGSIPRAKADDYLVITSDYAGVCRGCRHRFDKGARIAWRRDHGATHYRCRGFWADPETFDPVTAAAPFKF